MIKAIKENRFIAAITFSLSICLLICFAQRMWIPIAVIIGIVIFNILFLGINNLSALLVFSMALSFSPKSLYICYPFLILLFIYSLIKQKHSGNRIIKFDFVTICWLVLCLMGVVSIYKWQFPWLGIQWLMALAVIPLIIYIMMSFIKRDNLLWIFQNGLPLIFAVIVAFTFIQVILLLAKNDYMVTANNIMSFHALVLPGNGSNRLAGILSFIAVFGLSAYPLFKGEWNKNIALLFIFISSLMFSFLIMSRGALISLVFATVAYFWVYFIKNTKTQKMSKIILVLTIVVILLLVLKPFIDTMGYRMKMAKYDYASIFRLILWYNSIVTIIDHPIIGSGPGQHPFVVLNESHEDPHNFILRYGVDFGGLSILFIMAIVIYPFSLIYKKYRQDKNIGFFLIGVFGPPSFFLLSHSLMEILMTSWGFGPFYWFYWAIFIFILKDEILINKMYSIYNGDTISGPG